MWGTEPCVVELENPEPTSANTAQMWGAYLRDVDGALDSFRKKLVLDEQSHATCRVASEFKTCRGGPAL
jgi:hypothetical protein